ncbi:MAG: bifunctional serine/threonine-protein kinase/formylglycine-generating enzyme family protein, partial [Planctomycetota bacterium]
MEEDPFIGKNLGSYKILEKVGEGGMGAVYRAVHENLQREDAIKILPDRLVKEHPQVVERFLVEARAAARVNDPHIVQVHDAGVVEGVHYITMEYVKGLTLKELMARKSPLPVREALKIVVQAAKGLQAAARKKVIHRDIKPANIMLADPGVVKVADFGLAKNLDADLNITHSGQSLGTPAYMSPEQGEGEAADFRSDIYSLGVCLFEMVTGKRPFAAESAVGLLMKHAQAPVPDPLSIQPGLPEATRSLLMKMLAKPAEERHQSYEELIEELLAFKAGLEKGKGAGADETPVAIHSDSDRTPVTMHTEAASPTATPPPSKPSAESGETPPPAEEVPSRPTGLLIAGGIGVMAVLLMGLLAVLGVFGGGKEEKTPKTPPADGAKPEKEDSGKKIREILDQAKALEGKQRYKDALVVLRKTVEIDPDHAGAEKVRRRIEAAIEASRKASEKEDFYKQYWTQADVIRPRADRSGKVEDWALVIEYATKALDHKKTVEAKNLLEYATVRRDWALARRAADDGNIEEALRLAAGVRARDAGIAGLDDTVKQWEKKKTEVAAQEDRKRRFDALATQAEEEEAKGSEGRAAALETWKRALDLADGEEDRTRARDAIQRLESEAVYRDAMAAGKAAEGAQRWEEALANYEKASKTNPDDADSAEAVKRVRARIAEIEAKKAEEEKAAERRRLYASLLDEAQAAEKNKGKLGALHKALVAYRKALPLAETAEARKTIEGKIRSLIGPVYRRGMAAGRTAEARKDWVGAERAYERAAAAKPEDRNMARATQRVLEKSAAIRKLIGTAVDIPRGNVDQHSNPLETRNGAYCDPESGLPYEIWLRAPRLELVLVPVGRFKMGSPKTEPGHQSDESPNLNIAVGKPFYMGKYEITQKQWNAVLDKVETGFVGNALP